MQYKQDDNNNREIIPMLNQQNERKNGQSAMLSCLSPRREPLL